VVVPLSLLAVFAILAVIGLRAGKLHLGWGLVAFLAGFFTADTTAAPAIRNLIATIAHPFTHA
jgi:hypothetical protein